MNQIEVTVLCKEPGRVNAQIMIIISITEWTFVHSSYVLNQDHYIEVPGVRFQFNLKDSQDLKKQPQWTRLKR